MKNVYLPKKKKRHHLPPLLALTVWANFHANLRGLGMNSGTVSNYVCMRVAVAGAGRRKAPSATQQVVLTACSTEKQFSASIVTKLSPLLPSLLVDADS